MNSNKSKYLISILVLALILSTNIVGAQPAGNSATGQMSGSATGQMSGTATGQIQGSASGQIQGQARPGVAGSGTVTTIDKLQNPLKGINSIGELIRLLIQIFTYIAIIFAVLVFIYLGFQYVVNAANGNSSKIKELHERLLWLVIGVAIVIGARVIIEIAINTLSATGTVDTQIIDSAKDALSQTKNP